MAHLYSNVRYTPLHNEYDLTMDNDSSDKPTNKAPNKVWVFVKSHILLWVLFLVYSFSGAALFNWLESDNELEFISTVEEKREETLDRLWSMSSGNNLTEVAWKAMVYQHIVRLQKDEKALLQPSMTIGSTEPVWNYWSSLMFCGTIYTTIGR